MTSKVSAVAAGTQRAGCHLVEECENTAETGENGRQKELEAHMDRGTDRPVCRVAWLGQDPFLSISDPPVRNNFI